MPRDSVADRPFQVGIRQDHQPGSEAGYFDDFHYAQGLRVDHLDDVARREYRRERSLYVRACRGLAVNRAARRYLTVELPRAIAAGRRPRIPQPCQAGGRGHQRQRRTAPMRRRAGASSRTASADPGPGPSSEGDPEPPRPASPDPHDVHVAQLLAEAVVR